MLCYNKCSKDRKIKRNVPFCFSRMDGIEHIISFSSCVFFGNRVEWWLLAKFQNKDVFKMTFNYSALRLSNTFCRIVFLNMKS